MSHIVTVDVKIKDLDALRRAGEALGLRFNEGAKTFHSYQKGLKCDHSLSVANPQKGSKPYEIGVKKTEDGDYQLLFDPFAQGYGLCPLVESSEGAGDLGRLLQGYALNVARKQALREGYTVHEVRGSNGAVTLTLSR